MLEREYGGIVDLSARVAKEYPTPEEPLHQCGNRVDGFHAIVDKEDLPTSCQFEFHRRGNQRFAALSDVSLSVGRGEKVALLEFEDEMVEMYPLCAFGKSTVAASIASRPTGAAVPRLRARCARAVPQGRARGARPRAARTPPFAP